MVTNQANILESLAQICTNLNKDEFIYSFLDAYGLPKSTITLLRKNDRSRSIGINGDIGLKKKIYFKSVATGTELDVEIEDLKSLDIVNSNEVRFIVVTDFVNLLAYDTKVLESLDITIAELPKQYAFFLPLAGYEKAIVHSEHPADIRASEKMGRLFDLIGQRNRMDGSKDIHALNVFLTRLLFCLYAEDTGIFESGQLSSALKSYTKTDGSDVSRFLSDLFLTLNMKFGASERLDMPAHIQAFPYVNGGLFEAKEPVPEFGRLSRKILLECGLMDWSEINPDIFGSMFQAVIDEQQRGNLGQHYTSVSNIMKVIRPLFLDGLYNELERGRSSAKLLRALLLRVQNIHIFDPACGSGNFLIIAYKELRKFEIEVIAALENANLLKNKSGRAGVSYQSKIRLNQFFGIELDDFAHEIATLSLWLAEHQMNMAFKAKFGYTNATLPLKEAGNIICGNSLRLDWEVVCPKANTKEVAYETYICGNPPFLGHGKRTVEQLEDMAHVFSHISTYKSLDLVSCWFWKSSQYIKGTDNKVGLVSTNSVTQGKQVADLWMPILELGVSIAFAYQSFVWANNARDKAGVHVVIIGLAAIPTDKKLYSIQNNKVIVKNAKNISPYLLEAGNSVVRETREPLCDVIKMSYGNMPADGGALLLEPHERDLLVKNEPKSSKWIKRIYGAVEFIRDKPRFCLWLVDATDAEIKAMPLVNARVESVRKFRMASKDKSMRKLAEKPHQFRDVHNPDNFIVIPYTSSQRREYIPLGFMNSNSIASNLVNVLPNATLYDFGVLTSELHNDWMRTVGSKLKSDYRYSTTLVYNTFPWPDVSAPQRENIIKLAEDVLMAREDCPDKTLADLYDPNKMPDGLLAAHKALDRAVDKLYRDTPFRDTSERLEHLFNRYKKLVVSKQEMSALNK